MHRTTLCHCTNRYSRPGRILQIKYPKRLLNAGAGYQVDDDRNVIEGSSSWEDHHAREVGRRLVTVKDVVIDDLSATLEAHRASNRASVIRKIHLPPDTSEFFFRPTIDGRHEVKEVGNERLPEGRVPAKDGFKRCLDGDQAGKTPEGDVAAMRIWPADSTQAQRAGGGKGWKRVRLRTGNNFVKSTGVLEYTGKSLRPAQAWANSTVGIFQRPWLAYMEEHSGDGLKRYVVTVTPL